MPPPAHHFEHLPLVLRDRGPARFPKLVIPEDPTTATNKSNRAGHADGLRSVSSELSAGWQSRQAARAASGLPPIAAGIPLLLSIDTSLDLDDLRRQFNFEIVSEHEERCVIVVSEDVNLADFQQKLTDFAVLESQSEVEAEVQEELEIRVEE